MAAQWYGKSIFAGRIMIRMVYQENENTLNKRALLDIGRVI